MCVRHIEITTLEMVDVCTYMWQSAIGAQSSLIIAWGQLIAGIAKGMPCFHISHFRIVMKYKYKDKNEQNQSAEWGN